ncbi:hypothetical protein Ocin01_01014 [Orchesella cincta]|uniref:Uncharacterized protein n=1 Tax=Orchesella cincta TaxID=48709 RepID=A0A1D2NKN1_ORCCI|nr:hypothetical protein Ocin01_01014 [Orchesella cincta]
MERLYTWPVIILLLHLQLAVPTHISICYRDTTYEYPLESCPGGIQLRNVGKWFSRSRSRACISGDGALLQFDGEGTPWEDNIFPRSFPDEMKPFIGNWVDYHLQSDYELIQGNKTSILFIDARKFQQRRNFPTKTLELVVTPYETNRLAGRYTIELKRGLNNHAKQYDELLRTVIHNTQDPVLIALDPNDRSSKVCAFHPEKPEVVLTKYITSAWNVDHLEDDCEDNVFPTYERKRLDCPINDFCSTNKKVTTEGEENLHGKLEQFQQLLETMAEASVRMKHSGEHLKFHVNSNRGSGLERDQPFMAMLQRSARVFYRGFPEVVKWETLMNALSIFAVTFEGLLPSEFQVKQYDQVRIALGRCATDQDNRRADNYLSYNQTCTRNADKDDDSDDDSSSANKTDLIVTVVTNSSSSETTDPPAPAEPPTYNKLIELLWKVVQFTQAACFPSHDHHPNIHHFYASAMLELFSTPAVQLLWFQNPGWESKALDRVMLHIFPELPDNTIPTMNAILEKYEFSIHFNILQRPQLMERDKRDMRCAGHGKLIWNGRACCYLQEDDKKFRYINRVAFAKI